MAKAKTISIAFTLPQLSALSVMVSNSWDSMGEDEREQLLDSTSATLRDGAAVAKKVSKAFYLANGWPKEVANG